MENEVHIMKSELLVVKTKVHIMNRTLELIQLETHKQSREFFTFSNANLSYSLMIRDGSVQGHPTVWSGARCSELG